jgi:hypothetical protein
MFLCVFSLFFDSSFKFELASTSDHQWVSLFDDFDLARLVPESHLDNYVLFEVEVAIFIVASSTGYYYCKALCLFAQCYHDRFVMERKQVPYDHFITKLVVSTLVLGKKHSYKLSSSNHVVLLRLISYLVLSYSQYVITCSK